MERVYLLEYSICSVHMPPPPSNCCSFLEEQQFHWMCTVRNQWMVLVLILRQEATCIISGDREQPCISSCCQCKQKKKTLAEASEQAYNSFVYMFKTQLTINYIVNQKLFKSIPRGHSIWGDYTRGKYLGKNLGTWRLKRGEAGRAYFWKLTIWELMVLVLCPDSTLS